MGVLWLTFAQRRKTRIAFASQLVEIASTTQVTAARPQPT
eukprot:CCRYP_010113-RB/>CCRYP_010113-RB protein AED:0.46 eAED:1.00 QI:0/-1/0/1/-1/0/1/0/39